MYYPYLRGRQFELIALRELAIEGATQGHIIPIIEPVKETYNNLDLANRILNEHEQVAYIIVNPLVGERPGDHTHILDYLAGLGQTPFLPAFHYAGNEDFIQQCIQDFELTDCLLICQNDVDPDNETQRELLELETIIAICVEDPGRNRTLDRFIKNLDKTYIRLDDLFEKKARNLDFLNIQEHRFSEEHIYFEDDGYGGFSDFTILPSEYSDGGSTPRAVVIHFTYLNAQSQVWIRHFTSDSNDSIANVQGKFAEAAEKAVTYCRQHGLTNSAIEELEEFYDKEHYPGLGTIKKISIKNHLLIIEQYLSRD